jgi:exosome complex component MTR3
LQEVRNLREFYTFHVISSLIQSSYSYSDKGQIYCDFKYAPFSTEIRKSSNENDEKLMASNIKKALESTVSLFEFPNYQIDIFIMVLDDDGSVLSTSIIAAGLALVDAGYSCYDLLTSSTISIVDGEYLIDPTKNEEEISEKSNHGTMTVSCLSSLEQVAQIQLKGYVDPNHLKQAKKHLVKVNEQQRLLLKSVIFNSKLERNS